MHVKERTRGVRMALAIGAATLLMAGAWATPATAATSAKSVTANVVPHTLVVVPHVAGMTLSAAEHAVAYVGLNPYVRYIDNDCTINRVVYSDPPAGAVVAVGSTVTLWVHPICNGPQP